MIIYVSVLLPFIITPGASYALTIAAVEEKGLIGTKNVMIGTGLGIAVHACFAAAGISSLMMELPNFTQFIRVIGSVMLIYLGVSIFINLLKPTAHKKSIITAGKVFMLNIFNIKPILLYLTVIPSFLQENETADIYTYYFYFGVLHILLQITWLLLLGHLVSVTAHQKLNWMIKIISAAGSLFLVSLGMIYLINLVWF